uniref:PDZ domain-containing protein n=1 Tax=Gasterosteus aculeatus TaxID=69293 RepID=G3NFP8_GASAC
SASSAERQQVVGALERLRAKLVQREDWTHSETLGNLSETLQSPLFSHILTLQHSIQQLRSQLNFATLGPNDKNKGYLTPRLSVLSTTSLQLERLCLFSPSHPPISVTADSAFVLCVKNKQPTKFSLSLAPQRHSRTMQLTRPLSGGLGFSVVGLNPAGSSNQDVFVKHIQPGGIAHRDGRLQERDQILVINGVPL